MSKQANKTTNKKLFISADEVKDIIKSQATVNETLRAYKVDTLGCCKLAIDRQEYRQAIYKELQLITSIETIRKELTEIRKGLKDEYTFIKRQDNNDNKETKAPKKTQFNTVNSNTRYVLGYYILLQEKQEKVKKACTNKLTQLTKDNKASKRTEAKKEDFDFFTCARLNHIRNSYILQRDYDLLVISKLMLQMQQKFDIVDDLYNTYCQTVSNYNDNIDFFKQAISDNFKQCYNITLCNKDIDKFVFLMDTKNTSIAKDNVLIKALDKMPFVLKTMYCIGQMLIDVKLIDREVYSSNKAFMDSIKDSTIHEIAQKTQELYTA